MTIPQMLIFAILAATMALFLWGRLRHDIVALVALMACVAAGPVPAADAFAGFGHPAVIMVACVLVLSQRDLMGWTASVPVQCAKMCPSATCFRVNAFWASVNFDAFIISTPPSQGNYSRKLQFKMLQFPGSRANKPRL